MRKYNLNFISDSNLFQHVENTIKKYRFNITLKDFNKNLIDPIKLTFDSKVYNKNLKEIIENEISRQLDKSNTNHIGYFHQNIFHYIGVEEGWSIPTEGYDVANEKKHIYVEMKNKHNTMNSSSSQKTYMRMQNTLINNPSATCMLVEVIATNSQNIPWVISLDKQKQIQKQIRRVSIDKFYEIVTNKKYAFKKLCEALPKVIGDIVNNIELPQHSNTVLNQLEGIDEDLLKSLYLLSFRKYEGFDDFNV